MRRIKNNSARKKALPRVMRYTGIALMALGMVTVFFLVSLGRYQLAEGFDAAGPVWNGVIAGLELLAGVLGLWFWRKKGWGIRLVAAGVALIAVVAAFIAAGPAVAKWPAVAGMCVAAVYTVGAVAVAKKEKGRKG
jgi:peptidoglycan/LPS O-acetylase OafA/YrhL